MMKRHLLLRQLAIASLVALPSAALADQACIDAWSANIQSIVNQNCVACHQDAAPGQNLSLQRGTAPGSLLGVKSTEASELALIEPGDPSRSYLYLKITDAHLEAGGSGARMPLGGELSAENIAAIEAWILDCAP